MSTTFRFLSMPVAAAGFALGGCAFDDLLTDENNVAVFATHHATPINGSYPNKGRDNSPRIFETDTGWTVTLGEAWVVTTGITLVGCDGQPVPLQMWWGPLPEDMTLEDLENKSIAGDVVPGGDYCSVVVEYGPFTGSSEMANYDSPDAPEVMGASVFLSGNAKRGADVVSFSFRSTQPITTELDISALTNEGSPLHVESSLYPRELTVSKTYDRFFDGVAFDSMDEQAVEGGLLTIVGRETRVALGDRPDGT